jgi:hypothetical protein
MPILLLKEEVKYKLLKTKRPEKCGHKKEEIIEQFGYHITRKVMIYAIYVINGG